MGTKLIKKLWAIKCCLPPWPHFKLDLYVKKSAAVLHRKKYYNNCFHKVVRVEIREIGKEQQT